MFQSLQIAHFLKDASGRGLPLADESYLRQRGFFLDTCLRQLAIFSGPDGVQEQGHPNIQWFSDGAAYSFLLQTATGLNSAIPGESNVLGQFKHGWLQWSESATAIERAQLAPIMQQLFRDSAAIRHQHLQGIGGRSYGALVRKILQPATDAKILVIGAGELAQSILPYLQNYHVGIWNRTQLPADFVSEVTRVFAPEDWTAAAGWASNLVITTPAELANDKRWHELAARKTQSVVHLGCRRALRGVWSDVPAHMRFTDLDDLFDLRQRQSSVRSLRIGYARKACQWHAARLSFGYPDDSLPALVAQRA